MKQVKIEGGRETYLVLTEDLPVLDSLEKGKLPKGWKPKELTTLEEVTFLSPLDIVSARGRATKLFGFDYIWEVYVPAPKRRWGYYVLPILYGDDLVARLDPKLDRTTMTLEIKGFWPEDDAPVSDSDFANAFAKGLVRFAKFLNAKRVNVAAFKPVKLSLKPEDTGNEADGKHRNNCCDDGSASPTCRDTPTLFAGDTRFQLADMTDYQPARKCTRKKPDYDHKKHEYYDDQSNRSNIFPIRVAKNLTETLGESYSLTIGIFILSTNYSNNKHDDRDDARDHHPKGAANCPNADRGRDMFPKNTGCIRTQSKHAQYAGN